MIEKMGQKKKSKKYSIIIIIMTIVAICFTVLLINLFTLTMLIIRSPYRGYEVGYEDVVLLPSVFCSPEMLNVDGVEIDSELKTDKKHYTYETKTKKANTRSRDYLYHGKYDIDVSKDGTSEGVMIAVYDTQPPIYLSHTPHLIIEQGMTKWDLAGYFPIFDYDDETTVILFVENIDLNKPQRKTKATVLTHDSHGNEREKTIELTILTHKEADANRDKLTRSYTTDKPANMDVRNINEKDQYKGEISAIRKAYLDAERKLAEELGAPKGYMPDFDKYKDKAGEQQKKVNQGMSIDDVIKEAKEEIKKKQEEEEKKLWEEPKDLLKIPAIKPEKPKEEPKKPEKPVQKEEPKKEPEKPKVEEQKPETPAEEPKEPAYPKPPVLMELGNIKLKEDVIYWSGDETINGVPLKGIYVSGINYGNDVLRAIESVDYGNKGVSGYENLKDILKVVGEPKISGGWYTCSIDAECASNSANILIRAKELQECGLVEHGYIDIDPVDNGKVQIPLTAWTRKPIYKDALGVEYQCGDDELVNSGWKVYTNDDGVISRNTCLVNFSWGIHTSHKYYDEASASIKSYGEINTKLNIYINAT